MNLFARRYAHSVYPIPCFLTTLVHGQGDIVEVHFVSTFGFEAELPISPAAISLKKLHPTSRELAMAEIFLLKPVDVSGDYGEIHQGEYSKLVWFNGDHRDHYASTMIGRFLEVDQLTPLERA